VTLEVVSSGKASIANAAFVLLLRVLGSADRRLLVLMLVNGGCGDGVEAGLLLGKEEVELVGRGGSAIMREKERRQKALAFGSTWG
jgi:hypothetical protein